MPSPQPYRSWHGVNVEALQWQPDDPEAFAAAVKWLMALHMGPVVRKDFASDDNVIGWRDRYGLHVVEPGGWIVRLVASGYLHAFGAGAFAAEFVPAESEVAG